MLNQIQNRHRILLTGMLTMAAIAVPASAQQYPQYQYPNQQQVYAQQVNYPPQELERMVARIALYPDPLLAQIFAAATYPDQIPDAASWADQHHYLNGYGLAEAINNDRLYFEPSVQALLPFPSVLQMMAGDMLWTTSLGNAFLSQGVMLQDAVQILRQQAYRRGYLRSNNQVVVNYVGSYIELTPYNPGYLVVPYYDQDIFDRSYGGRVRINWGYGINLGGFFGSWGWGGNRFAWDRHEVIVNNAPWRRDWDNRVEYRHPYEIRTYERPGFGNRDGDRDRDRNNVGREGQGRPMPQQQPQVPNNRDIGRERGGQVVQQIPQPAPQPVPQQQPGMNRDTGRERGGQVMQQIPQPAPQPVPQQQPGMNRGMGRGQMPTAQPQQPQQGMMNRPAMPAGQAEDHTLRPRDDRERNVPPQAGGRAVETHRDDIRREERKRN